MFAVCTGKTSKNDKDKRGSTVSPSPSLLYTLPTALLMPSKSSLSQPQTCLSSFQSFHCCWLLHCLESLSPHAQCPTAALPRQPAFVTSFLPASMQPRCP